MTAKEARSIEFESRDSYRDKSIFQLFVGREER